MKTKLLATVLLVISIDASALCWPEPKWSADFNKGHRIYNENHSGGVMFTHKVKRGGAPMARDIVSFGTQPELHPGALIPEYIKRQAIVLVDSCGRN